MAKKQIDAKTANVISAQPRLHQRAGEIQRYGTVNHLLPLELEEPVRLEMTAQLNQLLADTCTRSPTGKLPVQPFISSICFTTNIMTSKLNWLTQLPNAFSCSAA